MAAKALRIFRYYFFFLWSSSPALDTVAICDVQTPQWTAHTFAAALLEAAWKVGQTAHGAGEQEFPQNTPKWDSLESAGWLLEPTFEEQRWGKGVNFNENFYRAWFKGLSVPTVLACDREQILAVEIFKDKKRILRFLLSGSLWQVKHR